MSKNQNNFLPLFSLLLGTTILAITGLYILGSPKIGNPKESAKMDFLTPQQKMIDDDVILGNPNAKLTITIFGDYECPYCKSMFDTLEDNIRRDYIDTGLANMVYRDFPIDEIHEFARPAALAAQCAGDQGKYWQYHDRLFEQQVNLPTLKFIDLAKNLGLNLEQFQSCLESNKYANEVELDFLYGKSIGVRATPTTFVGDFLIEGVPVNYQVIRSKIEEKLNEKTTE